MDHFYHLANFRVLPRTSNEEIIKDENFDFLLKQPKSQNVLIGTSKISQTIISSKKTKTLYPKSLCGHHFFDEWDFEHFSLIKLPIHLKVTIFRINLRVRFLRFSWFQIWNSKYFRAYRIRDLVNFRMEIASFNFTKYFCRQRFNNAFQFSREKRLSWMLSNIGSFINDVTLLITTLPVTTLFIPNTYLLSSQNHLRPYQPWLLCHL